MTDPVQMACEGTLVLVPLDHILPTKTVTAATKRTSKYRCIEASIRELGLIEPLVVYPKAKSSNSYLVLDGHVRLQILRDTGAPSAKCLVATDDEGFTHNHKVNRLSAIQEHFMILKAVKSGVSEERIAQTLNVDVSLIKQKRDLLEGVCPEAVHLLRDKQAPPGALRQLRRVKPMRQIEMAELMCATHNFTAGYAKCLVGATSTELIIDPDKPRECRGISAEDAARMEHEVETLVREFKIIEESHGKNTLNLVIVAAYLRRLLENARVVRYLSQNHREILTEFQKIVESRSLADALAEIPQEGSAKG